MSIHRFRQPHEITQGNSKLKVIDKKQDKRKQKKSEEYLNFKFLPQIFCYGFYQISNTHQFQLEFKRICLDLAYCIQKLEQPKIKTIEKKKVSLPSKCLLTVETGKKILFLDLDQTLIHTQIVQVNQNKQIQEKTQKYGFSIRPYVNQFLNKISKFFDIYIFTASTKQYSLPIVRSLNGSQKPIKGLLHRKHCLKTNCGLFIKDLRIIENHSLQDMVIVDNKIYSFAFQLTNGIPVQDFYGNREDTVLQNLEKFLLNMKQIEDIPQYIESHLKLQDIINFPIKKYMETFKNEEKLQEQN